MKYYDAKNKVTVTLLPAERRIIVETAVIADLQEVKPEVMDASVRHYATSKAWEKIED